jgi:hypothetical protein
VKAGHERLAHTEESRHVNLYNGVFVVAKCACESQWCRWILVNNDWERHFVVGREP